MLSLFQGDLCVEIADILVGTRRNRPKDGMNALHKLTRTTGLRRNVVGSAFKPGDMMVFCRVSGRPEKIRGITCVGEVCPTMS